ncbi:MULTISPECIES: hypothetical protein [Haloferax]|uniref:DUF8123 domain-containing protein n=1 Tax=Haloferax marinum TaxID=2666143 RepID=A0A6A8G8D4_9EURY|nr:MULTISPECIES: hypothetical protein [Haloferax]KAB1197800.1 hypothetical protein Hfx1150_09815 [Haloferax sp. CBA1150]MRW96858.1 hypothetical protein [Haloferax marinum]
MVRGTTTQWKTWMVVAVGTFVVLASAGTLVGMPWRYTAVGGVGTVLQILGGIAAIGIGVVLAWLGVTSVRKK